VRGTAEYLALYLADEDSHGPESRDWFKGLADHVLSLDPTDQRLVLAEQYLRPLFEDEALDAYVMYPESYAGAFLGASWGGEYDVYFSGCVAALRLDYVAHSSRR